MERRTRTVLVVGTALAAATVASLSVYRAVQRIPVREVEVAHEYVMVAARPLPLGTRLAESDLKRVGWPSDSPLSGAFAAPEDLVGRGVIAALGVNEPITEARLAPRGAGAGLSPAIRPGMRAISVKVNEVIGVAGFATPGARVDVLATVRRHDDSISRVLVANVPVLSAGTRQEQEESRDAKTASVITLMVTPAEAERIALAASEGQIALTLRNPLDTDEPATAGARLARLVSDPVQPVGTTGEAPGPAAPARVRPAPTPAEADPADAEPEAYIVEAIRAGQRTQEVVQ